MGRVCIGVGVIMWKGLSNRGLESPFYTLRLSGMGASQVYTTAGIESEMLITATVFSVLIGDSAETAFVGMCVA